jgi:hypothetical protein
MYKIKEGDEHSGYTITLSAEERAISEAFAPDGMKIGLPDYPKEYQRIDLTLKIDGRELSEDKKKTLYEYLKKEVASPLDPFLYNYQRWARDLENGRFVLSYERDFTPEQLESLCYKIRSLAKVISGEKDGKIS